MGGAVPTGAHGPEIPLLFLLWRNKTTLTISFCFPIADVDLLESIYTEEESTQGFLPPRSTTHPGGRETTRLMEKNTSLEQWHGHLTPNEGVTAWLASSSEQLSSGGSSNWFFYMPIKTVSHCSVRALGDLMSLHKVRGA